MERCDGPTLWQAAHASDLLSIMSHARLSGYEIIFSAPCASITIAFMPPVLNEAEKARFNDYWSSTSALQAIQNPFIWGPETAGAVLAISALVLLFVFPRCAIDAWYFCVECECCCIEQQARHVLEKQRAKPWMDITSERTRTLQVALLFRINHPFPIPKLIPGWHFSTFQCSCSMCCHALPGPILHQVSHA